MKSAIQLPIKPSPARYHVPVAQPPASTIPIPKINDPTIVPTIGNVPLSIVITPNEVNIYKPIAWILIAISNA